MVIYIWNISVCDQFPRQAASVQGLSASEDGRTESNEKITLQLLEIIYFQRVDAITVDEGTAMGSDWDARPWESSNDGSFLPRKMDSFGRTLRSMKERKTLKLDKWRAAFDSEGKLVGFQKAFKIIALGGVDPTIRAEVWEFLLGCYALGTTMEYQRQLRIARRERYKDLIKQCQMMHPSIGTGSLPYTIGSKVMDVRIMYRDIIKNGKSLGTEPSNPNRMPKDRSLEASNAFDNKEILSSHSTDYGSARENIDNTTFDSFRSMSSRGLDSYVSLDSEREDNGLPYFRENRIDLPGLFEEIDKRKAEVRGSKVGSPRQTVRENIYYNTCTEEWRFPLAQPKNRFETDCINASLNAELAEKKCRRRSEATGKFDCEKITLAKLLVQERLSGRSESKGQFDNVGRMKLAGSSELNETTPILGVVNEERVADWLWTVHRIVVDVIRTDRHLAFYGDSKNLARMSDILAVYAWVDPTTGYCQGMSDLLSPFVVLYEDDADAFWCFESLLRRVRHNFQMEGPLGVMKQLEALRTILQLTDLEIFTHITLIGAESLQFAFRMLLVLFRRELSFNDALSMWEMMWASDFDQALAWALESNCPTSLVLMHPRNLGASCAECGAMNPRAAADNSGQLGSDYSVSGSEKIQSICRSPFCGFQASNLWSKHSKQAIHPIGSVLRRKGDDDLSVFCVAAIIVLNRSKLIREVHSMDDAIKMFNDIKLEINVKQCLRMAIKLRKTYFRKLAKRSKRGD